MECEVCAVLESIRCDRIMKYVRLVEHMKRSKRPTVKLQAAISNVRSEADEAWKRLDAHRRVHAFGLESCSAQKCQYYGAETLLSKDARPICEACAADLETVRKPAQRDDSEPKAKTAIAG
jgi:hypothetical protein